LIVEVDREVWDCAARWLELRGLVKTLWRSREPKPLSRPRQGGGRRQCEVRLFNGESVRPPRAARLQPWGAGLRGAGA